jgi:heme/copper-type cytochrome/quinol oxidase subunit 2
MVHILFILTLLIIVSIVSTVLSIYFFVEAGKHANDLSLEEYYRLMNLAVVSLLFVLVPLFILYMCLTPNYRIVHNIDIPHKKLKLFTAISIGVALFITSIAMYVEANKSNKYVEKNKQILNGTISLLCGIVAIMSIFVYSNTYSQYKKKQQQNRSMDNIIDYYNRYEQ